jgi:hypothetical protein
VQLTNNSYSNKALGEVRPLSYQLRVSFDKRFDPAVDFFEMDGSLLDSVEILPPLGDNIIQEWDKYSFADYTDRVINIEWQREEEVPFSVNKSMCDVTLNNFDGYFTANSNSPINPFLLPRRPIRVLAGFGGNNLPQFVGLTDKVPTINRQQSSASIHAQDYLGYLFNKPLDQTVMLENKRTDEVLEELLQLAGLVPAQYSLQTAYNTIAFVYFKKGKKMGEAIKELMQAELGSFYMDESGVITFKTRNRTTVVPSFTFDSTSIIDYNLSDDDDIINLVEVKSKVLEVQPLQVVYASVDVLELKAGVQTTFFFSFEDAVTTIDTIDSYTANSASDGSGSDVTGNVNVVSTDLFADTVKVVFNNTSGATAYMTAINIIGTPARVAREIYYKATDDESIENFEERPLLIENNFIQDKDGAAAIALTILNYYNTFGSTIELTVKGNYALQIGDEITVVIDEINQNYRISKIVNTLGDGFRQRITAKLFDTPQFFILDVSELNSNEVLAP